MRSALFLTVFISPPVVKRLILRWFLRAKIGRRVKFGWFSAIAGKNIEIGDYTEIRPLTIVRCSGEVRIGAYSVISSMTLVYGTGSLFVGDHAYVGPQCLINVDRDVRLGNSSALGPRCMVFTHGSFLPYTEGYWVKFAPVTIGQHVWIAAGVFIHPGVSVGNNVFVNSRSVLVEDVPENAVVQGNPARRITTIEKMRRVMTPRRIDTAVDQVLKNFVDMILRGQLEIAVQEYDGGFRFNYRGRNYLITCIPSDHSDGAGASVYESRCIFLVNRRDWSPPAGLKDGLVFDFVSMQTIDSGDVVHAKLRDFMRMYFGIAFEYT